MPHNYYDNGSNYINIQTCCNNLPSVIPTSQFNDYIPLSTSFVLSPHHADQRHKQTAKLYLSLSAICVNYCRIGRLIDRQAWLNLRHLQFRIKSTVKGEVIRVLRPQLMQPVFLETKGTEQMKNVSSKFELARMPNVPQIVKVLYVY